MHACAKCAHARVHTHRQTYTHTLMQCLHDSFAQGGVCPLPNRWHCALLLRRTQSERTAALFLATTLREELALLGRKTRWGVGRCKGELSRCGGVGEAHLGLKRGSVAETEFENQTWLHPACGLQFLPSLPSLQSR